MTRATVVLAVAFLLLALTSSAVFAQTATPTPEEKLERLDSDPTPVPSIPWKAHSEDERRQIIAERHKRTPTVPTPTPIPTPSSVPLWKVTSLSLPGFSYRSCESARPTSIQGGACVIFKECGNTEATELCSHFVIQPLVAKKEER